MAEVEVFGQVGEQVLAQGASGPLRQESGGGVVVTELHGRYYEQALRGNLYVAQAIVTAPVIYTTAAGTGGPLIWNPPGSGVNVVPVALGYGITVVTTVAAALGLTGNVGQLLAPTATTVIDGRTSALIGGATGKATPYRIGTPTNAGGFLLPVADVHTGALTVDTGVAHWIDLGGALVCPPGGWLSPSVSATATTLVLQIALVYEEVKIV